MNHACLFVQGAYRDDDCKPVVLESVREAERRIAGMALGDIAGVALGTFG